MADRFISIYASKKGRKGSDGSSHQISLCIAKDE